MDDAVEKAKQQKQHNTLLLIACTRGFLEDVKQLLDMGADPTCTDKQGLLPIHFAAAHEKLEVVKLLWSKGTDMDPEDPAGRTPLHLAALGESAELITFLVSKGAWIDAFDEQDNSPLHLAARQGSPEVVQALLLCGAKTKLCNKLGLTPLGEALVRGRPQLAAELLSHGASLRERARGYSLLHLAAGVGREASVRFLLDRGADANDAGAEDGCTPLHSAALSGSPVCVQLLLQHGADANVHNKDGMLPLHLVAVAKADPKVAEVRRLLEAATASGKRSRPAAPPKPQQPQAAVAPADPSAAFRALAPAQQLSRLRRWAELPDGKELDKAAAVFVPEVKKRLLEAKSVSNVLGIHRALTELHADEEFQREAKSEHMRDIINEIKERPEAMDKYTSNAKVMHVMEQLRRARTIVQAYGQYQIEFKQLLAGDDIEATMAKDARLTVSFKGNLQAHLRAAQAAALQDDPAEAQEAAKAAYTTFVREYIAANPDTSKASGTVAKEPAASASSGTSPQNAADRASAPEASGQSAEAELPERPPFWKEFWKLMKRQLMQSAFMLLVMLLGMHLSGNAPWQRKEPPDAAAAAAPNGTTQPLLDVFENGQQSEL